MLNSRTRVASVIALTAWTTWTALISIALFTLPHSASADFYLHHWENEHARPKELNLGIQESYYQTTSDFDADGAVLLPTGLQKFSRLQTDATVQYGFTPRVGMYGRLGWTRAQLDLTTNSGSTFGFTDSTLGINVRAYEFDALKDQPHGIAIDVQLQGDFPLYSNSTVLTNNPPLGDGTTDITGGAFVTIPVYSLKTSDFSVTGGAGYTYRTSSYSSAVPWSASAALTPRQTGFKAQLSALGFESLRNDPRAQSLTTSSTIQSAAAGGSFMYAAVNPSLLTVRASAGYQFNPDLGVMAFASQSVWGQAAPNGFNAGAGLSAHFSGGGKTPDGAHLSPKEYGKSNQGFVNYAFEARVTRTNDRLNLIKIDKGSQDGVANGQTFDIFMVKKDGSLGETIARGKVTAVQSNEAALTIDEYFKEIWIDEGFIAKRPVE
jgi:hypothetical protein